MHILSAREASPSSYVDHITDEVNNAIRTTGDVSDIDVPSLVRSPFLNAAFHETLRLYVDMIVFRSATKNTALGTHYLQKNDSVIAPSYLCHRDAYWATRHFDGPEKHTSSIQSKEGALDVDEFHPERWIRDDQSQKKYTFSPGGTQGRFIPFGGGQHLCPGRVFAKQEVLAAVALVAAGLDMEVIGFTKRRSDGASGFPAMEDHIPGSTTVKMDGDLKVRVRRKVKWQVRPMDT